MVGWHSFHLVRAAASRKLRSGSLSLEAMARSSKLITGCVALLACLALRSMAFLGTAPPQLRGTPLEIAGAAVPAVLMTPTAAMAADGSAPSVVLGVGILCMLAAFSAVSSVISATVTSELD